MPAPTECVADTDTQHMKHACCNVINSSPRQTGTGPWYMLKPDISNSLTALLAIPVFIVFIAVTLTLPIAGMLAAA